VVLRTTTQQLKTTDVADFLLLPGTVKTNETFRAESVHRGVMPYRALNNNNCMQSIVTVTRDVTSYPMANSYQL
jgi:hypothetical protein